MVRKLLNKIGYYKLDQLKVGGMCGCCGKSIPRWIWVDCGDDWDDIGLCDDCQNDDMVVSAYKLANIVSKKKSR